MNEWIGFFEKWVFFLCLFIWGFLKVEFELKAYTWVVYLGMWFLGIGVREK